MEFIFVPNELSSTGLTGTGPWDRKRKKAQRWDGRRGRWTTVLKLAVKVAELQLRGRWVDNCNNLIITESQPPPQIEIITAYLQYTT